MRALRMREIFLMQKSFTVTFESLPSNANCLKRPEVQTSSSAGHLARLFHRFATTFA